MLDVEHDLLIPPDEC